MYRKDNTIVLTEDDDKLILKLSNGKIIELNIYNDSIEIVPNNSIKIDSFEKKYIGIKITHE